MEGLIKNSNSFFGVWSSTYGMILPGRNGQESSADYRYGFNGMEADDEIKGVGNSYTTEFRQYDPRVARWLSIDPKKNAYESPYISFSNNPILYIDPYGDTSEYYNMGGDLLGTINNEGPLERIKVNENLYELASGLYGRSKIKNQDDANKFVASINNYLDFYEQIGSQGHVISRETGNYQLDFTGQIIEKNEMTGRQLSTNNADYGITGVMSLNSIFDDGSLLTIEQYDFASGPYNNGPTPNNNYVVHYDNALTEMYNRPTFTSSTSEAGMLMNDGSNGFKVRLPDFNGRSGLLIHPDCNGIGTAGCIGIREDDATLIKLRNFFSNYIDNERRTLMVNFQIPNNPNYGNEGRAVANPGQ